MIELKSALILLALQDLRAKVGGDNTTPLIVMVVGAGRGPLVRASLRASERSDIAVFVYALDKNPNAGAQFTCLPGTKVQILTVYQILVPPYKY